MSKLTAAQVESLSDTKTLSEAVYQIATQNMFMDQAILLVLQLRSLGAETPWGRIVSGQVTFVHMESFADICINIPNSPIVPYMPRMDQWCKLPIAIKAALSNSIAHILLAGVENWIHGNDILGLQNKDISKVSVIEMVENTYQAYGGKIPKVDIPETVDFVFEVAEGILKYVADKHLSDTTQKTKSHLH